MHELLQIGKYKWKELEQNMNRAFLFVLGYFSFFVFVMLFTMSVYSFEN